MRISGKDTVGLAIDAVWSHKFRSSLTILGIVIGITTVVTVGSLLSGLKQGIVDFFKEFGPDSIFVAKVSGDPSGQNAPPKERRRKSFRPDYATHLKSMVRSIDDVGTTLAINPSPGHYISAKVPGYERTTCSSRALRQIFTKFRLERYDLAVCLLLRKRIGAKDSLYLGPAWQRRCFQDPIRSGESCKSMARRTRSLESSPPPREVSSVKTGSIESL
jgi:hypothetical protein